MKLSKFALTSVLALGVVGSAFAGGKTLASMNDRETQAVSMVAICSVANQKFSDLMTKNPSLRNDTAKTAENLKEILGFLMSDPREVRGMLAYADSKINQQNLPGTMAGCVEFIKNLK